MINDHNDISNDTCSEREDYGQKEMKGDANKRTLSPIAAISIITLIGLVCVVIDFYLESELEE